MSEEAKKNPRNLLAQAMHVFISIVGGVKDFPQIQLSDGEITVQRVRRVIIGRIANWRGEGGDSFRSSLIEVEMEFKERLNRFLEENKHLIAEIAFTESELRHQGVNAPYSHTYRKFHTP